MRGFIVILCFSEIEIIDIIFLTSLSIGLDKQCKSSSSFRYCLHLLMYLGITSSGFRVSRTNFRGQDCIWHCFGPFYG